MHGQSKRILLVNDDGQTLDTYSTACLPYRADWEVTTANSGAAALDLMGQGVFDAVVADMRMPDMSGLELLRAAMFCHPQTARILLSELSGRDMIVGSLGIVHQYLPKPCAPGDLLSAISRLMVLDQFFTNDFLRLVVARVRQLPSPPRVYFQLMRELARADATTESVGAIIAQDSSLSAKLLQVANSAFFSPSQPVMSVQEAVQTVGFNLVKGVALSLSLFASLNPGAVDEVNADRLYIHCLATALLAQKIATDESAPQATVDAAFTAGILHDIGKLVLASSLPGLYRRAVQLAADELIPQWQAEANIFGVDHAAVGAYLLGLWGLPAPIVEAVAWHHEPTHRRAPAFNALTAVHVADFLQSHHWPSSPRSLIVKLDASYVQSLDLDERIARWAEVGGLM
jgi:putative nucleotidyltransferase with HDIG domain